MPLALLIPPILIPLNILRGETVQSEIRGLDQFSWANVSATRTNVYWAHLIMALVPVAYICFVIHNEFFEFIRVRQEFLLSFHHGSSAYVNTVLVTDIPRDVLSIEGLSNVFRSLPGGVRQVWINQGYRNLIKRVEERESLIDILESTEATWLKKLVARKTGKTKVVNQHGEMKNERLWNSYLRESDHDIKRLPIFDFNWFPSLPFIGKKVDVIEYSLQKLSRLNIEIEEAQTPSDDLRLANSDFVQFWGQIASHLACQSVAYHLPSRVIVHRMEVASSNIIWLNLCLSWWNRYARSILFTTSVAALIFGWAFPIALTGLLSQVTYLTTIVPWLKHLDRLPATLLAFLQGILPQVTLITFLTLVPMMIRFCAEKRGFLLKTSIELAVQKFYFVFLFIQVL